MNKRLKIIALTAAVIAVLNTILWAQSPVRPELDSVSDVLIVLLAIILLPGHISLYRSTGGMENLAIASLFTIIAAIHALRLFFGGLPV